MLRDHLIGRRLSLIVKPNAHKTEIVQESPLKIAIAAPPENDKANIELLKFLKRHLGPVRLVSGATSRKKIVELID